MHTDWVGLLAGEAVASVDESEIAGGIKSDEDFFAEAYRLIRQDSHAEGAQPIEGFSHAGIEYRVIKHVAAIVREEKLLRAAGFLFGRAGAQRAMNEGGNAISNVAFDQLVRELRPAQMDECSVYGVDEIETRINQGAIEVENEEADIVELGSVARGHLFVHHPQFFILAQDGVGDNGAMAWK